MLTAIFNTVIVPCCLFGPNVSFYSHHNGEATYHTFEGFKLTSIGPSLHAESLFGILVSLILSTLGLFGFTRKQR